MSVKSMYRIGFSYLQKSGKENNLDLDSKNFKEKQITRGNCVLILMILNLHEFQKMKRITDKNLLVKLYLAKEKHWLRTIIITSVAGTISLYHL